MSEIPAALADGDSHFEQHNSDRRKRLSVMFYGVCVAIALLSVVILVVLIASIVYQGHSRVTSDLLTRPHSELEIERAGMWPSIVGSMFVCAVCAIAALPLGVGTAVFLEEFKPTNKVLRWLHGFVQLNISNLAGVPSIVYGLLGLTLFVYMFNIFGQIKVNESDGWEIMGAKHYYQVLTLETGHVVFIATRGSLRTFHHDYRTFQSERGRREIRRHFHLGTGNPETQRHRNSQDHGKERIGGDPPLPNTLGISSDCLSTKVSSPGGLTLALVILPIIIIASQESLRAVSPSLREASLGLGATTWQTVRTVKSPGRNPRDHDRIDSGIWTGNRRSCPHSRCCLGPNVSKTTGPKNLMDSAVVMPILIYNWAGRQQEAFKELSAAAIIILLILLLLLNSTAIYIRQKVQKTQS